MADITTEGFIPSEAYPLKLIHSDDNGHLILLLDEQDANSTIVVHSIDFEHGVDEGWIVPRADIAYQLMPYWPLSLAEVTKA